MIHWRGTSALPVRKQSISDLTTGKHRNKPPTYLGLRLFPGGSSELRGLDLVGQFGWWRGARCVVSLVGTGLGMAAFFLVRIGNSYALRVLGVAR
ncbi:Uncharacterised protein [Mycobacteroides abscessus subsp. massiliense]|nr:Uncharacterised protein [Mycobacteroides abscessus subsp. massiliense]